jgi:hypothetical protein
MGEGIELLRKKRGGEEVTFNDVCVEDIDHDHEKDSKRGMEPQQDAPH